MEKLVSRYWQFVFFFRVRTLRIGKACVVF